MKHRRKVQATVGVKNRLTDLEDALQGSRRLLRLAPMEVRELIMAFIRICHATDETCVGASGGEIL